jgi:hypothetical protein
MRTSQHPGSQSYPVDNNRDRGTSSIYENDIDYDEEIDIDEEAEDEFNGTIDIQAEAEQTTRLSKNSTSDSNFDEDLYITINGLLSLVDETFP